MHVIKCPCRSKTARIVSSKQQRDELISQFSCIHGLALFIFRQKQLRQYVLARVFSTMGAFATNVLLEGTCGAPMTRPGAESKGALLKRGQKKQPRRDAIHHFAEQFTHMRRSSFV